MLTLTLRFPCYKQGVSFFYLMRYHKVSKKQKRRHQHYWYHKLRLLWIRLTSTSFLTYSTLSLQILSKTKDSSSHKSADTRITGLRELKRLSLRGIAKELHSNETYWKFYKISDEIPS